MPSTSFADMPTLGSPSNTPSPPFHRRRKSWARKVERCCWNTFAYFPLAFVYGLTTWAVYVEITVSVLSGNNAFAYLRGALGLVLYTLANVSYTIAVFTNAGSPLDPRKSGCTTGRRIGGGYEGLPTYEEDEAENSNGIIAGEQSMSYVTAKSTGKPRYCKKCQTVKPDRTHHCSTCGKCVLKMDHHCPWLATCVGLRNYKPFLLFLIYTSMFCWMCFAVCGWWTWRELVEGQQMEEGLRVVNTILLAVLGGIIGLVLSGFTGWHIYLAVTGQTTIESLERTRYLSPLRKSLESRDSNGRNYLGQEGNGDDQPLSERLKEIHANALPGVLRPEEGEASPMPSRSRSPQPPPDAAHGSQARNSLQRSYASLEAQRERDRYNSYLDEVDSERLPNAFDMGWKRNLLHVFGDNPVFWFLPIRNTSGDGWQWEVSSKWIEERDRLGREREERQRADAHWNQHAQPAFEPPPQKLRWTPGQGFVDGSRNAPTRYLSERQSPARPADGDRNLQLQPLDRRKAGSPSDVDGCDTSSDEDRLPQRKAPMVKNAEMTNWNDIPDEFLASQSGHGARNKSRGRAKGD